MDGGNIFSEPKNGGQVFFRTSKDAISVIRGQTMVLDRSCSKM